METKNKTALLVIDMQVGLFNDPEYAMAFQERLFDNVNQVINLARAKAIPIIYIQHTEKQGLVYQSPDWQIDLRVHYKTDDLTCIKTHSDAFWDTDLQSQLEHLGMTELFILGCQTDYCVDTTVRRAASLGYKVNLVVDAHSTCSDGVLSADQIIAHHNQILCPGFASAVFAKSCDF